MKHRRQWVIGAFVAAVALIYWMIYRARRRRDHPIIGLASAMEHMKTGDLMLFSGRHLNATGPAQMVRRAAFLGATYVYRAVDACEWGHVAVVYRHPETNELLLLHCEMSSADPDYFAGEPVTGVQVTSLERKVRAYRGYCMWRPLNRALPDDLVHEYLLRTYHLPYRVPGDIWMRFVDRLAGARHRLRPADDMDEQKEGMLCSEWVGALLEHCGVFDKSCSPYKGYYLLSDFTAKRCGRYLRAPEWDYVAEGYELEP